MTKTQSELRREEALAHRVAFKEALARIAPHYKERDNLMILVISKLRPLTTADLNKVKDLIDTMTRGNARVAQEDTLWLRLMAELPPIKIIPESPPKGH
jgi:hypothetical protein